MQSVRQPPLLAIVGPTATGKTELAVQVAKKLNAEIISADSMLVYRFMNIGTAKPTKEEMEGITHHMVDVTDPDRPYNVAAYSEAVKTILKDIGRRKKVPLLVGGTGLYINAVIDGYSFSDAGIDLKLRNRLRQECEAIGSAGMHRKLAAVDPVTAGRLHVNDAKRIMRALEVCYLTGKPFSETAERKERPFFNLLIFGLTMDRPALYERIEKRVDQMIKTGLVEEVQSLLSRGYTKNLTSMQGLGYKEIAAYLSGEQTMAEAVETLKRNTKRFAKRQLTWFRRDSRIRWIDVGRKKSADVIAEITETAEGVLRSASNELYG